MIIISMFSIKNNKNKDKMEKQNIIVGIKQEEWKFNRYSESADYIIK